MNSCFWKCAQETEKNQKLFLGSFHFTFKNRFFQYQYQKQVNMFVFISWLVSHEVWIHIQTIFLWCDNTKYLELTKRRSKIQKNNMPCERALNFDQWKPSSGNYKPMRIWLWHLYKFTDNNCRSRLFSGFIQTHMRYPNSRDKMCILLVISS